MSTDFELAAAAATHAAELSALHQAVMGEVDGWREDGLARMLAARAARGWLATAAADGAGHTPAGFILAFAAADEAEVLGLAVAAEHRRRGLGRALLRRLSDRLAAEGIAHLHLEVRASNFAAQQLYRQCGFAETGRRRGYYAAAEGRPAEDAVTMAKPLVPPGARER